MEFARNNGLFRKTLDLTVDGARPSAWRMHPKFESHARDMQAYDVAVLKFTRDFQYSELVEQGGAEGDSIVMVGYGMLTPSQLETVGVKRVGRNRINQSVFGQFLIYGSLYDPSRSAGAQGDSGGPLFNDRLELIGTTGRQSASGMVLGGERVHLASYVDLNAPEIWAFLVETFGKLKADVPSVRRHAASNL